MINQDLIVKSIFSLAPNAEFTFNDCDIDSLNWISKDIPQPLKKDILAQMKIEEEKQIQEIENRENARQSALSKLIDLGLTEEEVKAFLG